MLQGLRLATLVLLSAVAYRRDRARCGRPFPAGPAWDGTGHFVSQRLRFFRDRVEFCRFGELPVQSEANRDGGGGSDRGPIRVEICRIRRVRRVGGATTGPTPQVIQKGGEIKLN